MSTQSHNPQKLLVSTRYTPENSRRLHDIKVDILKLKYHHPRMFVWVSGLEGEFLGLGLWYIVKELRYLLFKRHNDKKTGQVTASFSLSSNHSLLSVKF